MTETTLDIEGALAAHLWVDRPNELCACGLSQPRYGVNRMEAHIAHVATTLRKQIAGWLTSEFDRRWDSGDYGAAETVDALRKQVRP